MLDPIVNFFTSVFQWIGRGFGWLVGIALWPFLWLGSWYTRRGWIVRGVVGAIILGFLAFYGFFIWNTQVWTGFDPDYPTAKTMATGKSLAGDPIEPGSQPTATAEAGSAGNAGAPVAAGASGATQTAQAPAAPTATCVRSALVDVAAELIDLNVNQNRWIPSMLASKGGFFGIPWKNTPFLDNKAAFQLGVNQVIRRTTTELVDTLGRVRGTSQIDQNLQDARGHMNFDEDAWYFGFSPFGFRTPTPGIYRQAMDDLKVFNGNLEQCKATFDARADNLLQFVERIAADIGSTSDILRARLDASNAGWFDTRADDRFWFAYGQLYAYYGILTATRADFSAIVAERNMTAIWARMTEQLRIALDMQPAIISNGKESSFLFPSHLATMGFYLLRVRSNLVEIRSVLDR